MRVVFLDATVTGSAGKQESVRFLVDSGVMYTLLPRRVWRAIGLRPTDAVTFVLEDGTQVKRKLSECQIALAKGSRHTTVMLGAETDEAVLGRVTLSEFGLMLNPFHPAIRTNAAHASAAEASCYADSADRRRPEVNAGAARST